MSGFHSARGPERGAVQAASAQFNLQGFSFATKRTSFCGLERES